MFVVNVMSFSCVIGFGPAGAAIVRPRVIPGPVVVRAVMISIWALGVVV